MKKILGFAGKMYRIVRPVRDRHYLAFIRRFPCVACKSDRRQREAMHIGPHGMGQKASDANALPGCRVCHGILHSIGPRKFQSRHEIDFAALTTMFQAFYAVEFPDRRPPVGDEAA